MRAAERWKSMIQLEHAQSDRFRGSEGRPADHWQAFAQQFRADPRRSDDPLVNCLLRELSPHETLIDVGAGGGRLALPLALNCRHVVAVEPSPSMASVLRDQIAEYSIHNLTVVANQWEDAEVEEADVVLCVHVLYTIQEIERFVSKLQDHARKRVLIVLFQTPPQAQTYTLWQEVHGEERLPLPSLPEFQDVLSDMGITANVELLPAQTSRGFDDVQQAVDQLGRRLFLEPGSQKMARLENLLPGLLEPSDGAFILRGSKALVPELVWWDS